MRVVYVVGVGVHCLGTQPLETRHFRRSHPLIILIAVAQWIAVCRHYLLGYLLALPRYPQYHRLVRMYSSAFIFGIALVFFWVRLVRVIPKLISISKVINKLTGKTSKFDSGLHILSPMFSNVAPERSSIVVSHCSNAFLTVLGISLPVAICVGNMIVQLAWVHL